MRYVGFSIAAGVWRYKSSILQFLIAYFITLQV